MAIDYVWVFTGNHNHFPAACFSNYNKAIQWIRTIEGTGTLTRYPLNVSVYDWAIDGSFFSPAYPSQMTGDFKSNFSSAYLRHSHFVNGIENGTQSSEEAEQHEK